MKHAFRSRISAFVAAFALIASGMVATTPVAFADPGDSNCETRITSGTLDWGIKQSFRAYIANPAAGGAGQTELNGGVTGEYSWPVDAGSSTETDVRTNGSVHYTKHNGMLDITISDVRLVNTNGSWTIHATAQSKELSSGEMKTYSDIAMVELAGAEKETKGSTINVSFTSAVLTEAAAPVFGNYGAGTEMDVPALTLKTEETCTPSSDPTTPAADPTTPNPTPNTDPSDEPSNTNSAEAPNTCTPWDSVKDNTALASKPASAQGVTDASLVWGFSEYAQEWKAEAISGATYDADAKVFTFDGGIGWVEGAEATITWNSDIKLYPYGNLAYPGISDAMKAMNFHFTSPQLTVNSDGSGTLKMSVASTGMTGTESEAQTVTVANFAAGALSLNANADGWQAYSGTPAYDGQTYDYTATDRNTGERVSRTAEAAWPKEFIDALDASLRAYWYKSGASKDGEKTPQEVSGSFNTTRTYTWKNSDDTVKTVVVTACEDTPAAPEAPTREGYTFTGWEKTEDTSGAVTYAAVWKAVETPNTNTGSNSTSNDANAAPAQTQECVVDPTKTRATSGSLTWGLRSSFTNYIRGSIAHGSITGSAWQGSTFSFPISGGLFDTTAKTGTFYFSGDAHFTGHNGKLNMTIANPYVVVNGSTGRLYMDVSSTDSSGNQTVNTKGVYFADVTFSSVNATNSSAQLETSAVTLTADGAKAFAGYYSAGEALDTLSINAALVPDSECDASGNKITYDAFGRISNGSGLASTGAYVAPAAIVALFALVAGLLLAARRREMSL